MARSISLAGMHCAVVGATGAIGLQMAKAFAAEGAVLTLLSRRAEQHQSQLRPQLQPYVRPRDAPEATPVDHRFIKLDVRDPGSIRAAFSGPGERQAGDKLSLPEVTVGPVDVLINCAGVSQTTVLKRTSEAEMSNVIDTNLMATMLACKYAQMRSNGCIINVSSLMANRAGAGASVYAASKAGVVGFTRALCRELAFRSIRVNALLPGWVKSPMWDELRPQVQEKYTQDIPLGRPATADEVAGAAVFLATNGYANNCVLNLDGGLSAV